MSQTEAILDLHFRGKANMTFVFLYQKKKMQYDNHHD